MATNPSNYPYADIASAARRGRFFGRGPKGYRRSDERIREEISDRLMAHPDIDASDIEVVVANGVVTLTGTAEDRHEKRLAEYIADDALGVDDVENLLKVRHGFWASVTGERAIERELPARSEHDTHARSESGEPGGGAGRRDEVGPTGVYPMSAGIPPGKHLELRTPAAWGQGDRGADGYNDAGGSELVMRDGQLLGGLTAGPGGEPTIDIHGGDDKRSGEDSPDAKSGTTKRK